MVTMSIKAYCVNVVVSIKPIYFNKHLSFSVSFQLQRKTMICCCKENVNCKWDPKTSGM